MSFYVNEIFLIWEWFSYLVLRTEFLYKKIYYYERVMGGKGVTEGKGHI